MISLVVARVILGFGEGATFPTATRAMSYWTPKEKRGFAQGITHAFSRLGNSLTPWLVAVLILTLSWRASFIIIGCVSMFWALAWGLYFRDDPNQHKAVAPEEIAALPAYGSKTSIGVKVPWGHLIVRMIPVTVVYFCYGWILWLFLSWIPSFFKGQYHLDLKNSALFASGVFLSGVVADAGRPHQRQTFQEDAQREIRPLQPGGGDDVPVRDRAAAHSLHPQYQRGRIGAERWILLRGIYHRSHVGDPHGYRAQVFRHRQRSDEHRFGAGRHHFAGSRRVPDPKDGQLAAAIHRLIGVILVGSALSFTMHPERPLAEAARRRKPPPPQGHSSRGTPGFNN